MSQIVARYRCAIYAPATQSPPRPGGGACSGRGLLACARSCAFLAAGEMCCVAPKIIILPP